MIDWEGAELCYYLNGESYSVSLTNTQFAVVAKILGLESLANGSVLCFSDDSLKKLVKMKGNPLQLKNPQP